MMAMFDGQDYMLILDKEKGELQQLQQGEKLEAALTEDFGDKDLGKVVSLELADNKGSDGIELTYIPEGTGWEAIQRVQVKMNERAHAYVSERKSFGTRYGLGDKIEIFNGDPRFE